MKRQLWRNKGIDSRILLVLLAALVFLLAAGCGDSGGEEQNTETETQEESQTTAQTQQEEASTSSQVAGEGDKTEEQQLDVSDLTPVKGEDLKDGTYEITVDSSSAMFSITSCALTVENGKMTAVLTMSGTGYSAIYPGTAQEAAAAGEEDVISYVEDKEGAFTFNVPVEELNALTDWAAYSKKKELWYDRTLVFRADALPSSAYQGGAAPAGSVLADGTYTVEVEMTGGSGKTTLYSPAELTVKEGEMTVILIFDSPNYDYVKIGEVKYERAAEVDTDGSPFAIPIPALDVPISILADTTAMSKPHEIAYTVTFDPASVQEK